MSLENLTSAVDTGKSTDSVCCNSFSNPQPHSSQQDEPRASLIPKHYQECTEKRGLKPTWVEANCRSLTAQEASIRLGYPAKSAGILLEGQGIQIQLQPDKPWKNEGDKKAAKYRSPLGDYDAMLP